MLARTSLALLCFWLAAAVGRAQVLTITAPLPSATLHGTTFSLAWQSDPNEIGTSVGFFVDDIHVGDEFQNGLFNRVTLAVPAVEPNTPHTLKLVSYWRLSQNISPAEFSQPILFADSIPYLHIDVPNLQAGETFTFSWTGLPEITGTALRLDLYYLNDYLQTLGYVYDYTSGARRTFSCPMPHAPQGPEFRVRITSLFRESQREPQEYRESDKFILLGQPYMQILSPAGGAAWGPGLHHLLWLADPNFVGTALRIDLYDEQGFVRFLGNKFDNGFENDFALPMPPVQATRGGRRQYQIRLLSPYQQQAQQAGVPTEILSAPFSITGPAANDIDFPTSKSAWKTAGNNQLRLQYRTEAAVWGSAVRADLYVAGGRVRTLGNNFANTTSNTLYLENPEMVPTTGTVRLTSYWLESRQQPLQRAWMETVDPIFISPEPSLHITQASIEEPPGTTLELLHLSFHTKPSFYGTAYRVELFSQTHTVQYKITDVFSDAEDQTYAIWLRPLPTGDHNYKVVVTSYWAERHPQPRGNIAAVSRGLVSLTNPRQTPLANTKGRQWGKPPR